MRNTTPDNITSLKAGQIFVFGANHEGNHAAGAARTAVNNFGAIEGQGEGLQGQSYGIITMSGWSTFKAAVKSFLVYARMHPEYEFLVTKVGCGIAGFTEQEVAPLFKDAGENVDLPEGWGVTTNNSGDMLDAILRALNKDAWFYNRKEYREAKAAILSKYVLKSDVEAAINKRILEKLKELRDSTRHFTHPDAFISDANMAQLIRVHTNSLLESDIARMEALALNPTVEDGEGK